MDKFCLRQFNKGSSLFVNYDPKDFEEKINEVYLKYLEHHKDSESKNNESILKPGYAPFCKHIFVENFVEGLKPCTIEINEHTEHAIKTAYEARTEKELPVLKRYIQATELKGFEIPTAQYLDVILYSKAQIILENASMGEVDPNLEVDYDFGIISIKPQNTNHELPMDPITVLRNALGKEEGGSGVPLERTKYLESVEYWSKNILVKYA